MMSTWCSKHVEAWNKNLLLNIFCASSWLNTEINRCFFIQLHTKHINILCGQNEEFSDFNLVVHKVTTAFYKWVMMLLWTNKLKGNWKTCRQHVCLMYGHQFGIESALCLSKLWFVALIGYLVMQTEGPMLSAYSLLIFKSVILASRNGV